MRDVKSPAASLRAERALITRRRVEAAARRLFADHGYAATTLREVAADAGVAVQTVYAVYGTKANVLRALLRTVINDPEADAAYRAALAAETAAEARAAFARSIRLRWERGQDVVMIHAAAASADPELRAEADGGRAARRRGILDLARRLSILEPVPGGVERVAAMIDGLTLPAVYAVLTTAYGWTPDAYEQWLARMLGVVGSIESSSGGVEARVGAGAVGHAPNPTDGP